MTQFYHKKRMRITIFDPGGMHYRTIDVRHAEIWEARREAEQELQKAERALDWALAIPAFISKQQQQLLHQVILESGMWHHEKALLLPKVRAEAQREIAVAGILVKEIGILERRLKHITQALRRRHKSLRKLSKSIAETQELQRYLLISFCLDLRDDRREYLEHTHDNPNGGQWPPFLSRYFDNPVEAPLEPEPPSRENKKASHDSARQK